MRTRTARYIRHIRRTAIRVAITLAVVHPASAIAQQAPTEAQMTASDAKIQLAVGVLDREWKKIFAASGDRYISPRVTGFSGTLNTRCGVLVSGNAYACGEDGNIYYDRAFLATLMAMTAAELHTDGDMGAIFPIAHEWGHAVQYMLKLDYTSSPTRIESDADCLAGAIIGESSRDGHLERGDIEESEYSLRMAGDPPLTNGPWGQAIEQMNRQRAPGTTPVITNAIGGHGNLRERVESFHNGLDHGPRRCIQGIPLLPQSTRSPWLPPLP